MFAGRENGMTRRMKVDPNGEFAQSAREALKKLEKK